MPRPPIRSLKPGENVIPPVLWYTMPGEGRFWYTWADHLPVSIAFECEMWGWCCDATKPDQIARSYAKTVEGS